MSRGGTRQRLGIAIAAALTVTLTAVEAADDAYLQALENEAADASVDPATRQPSQASRRATVPTEGDEGVDWNAGRQGLGTELPPDLDRRGFEQVLQLNFIGTYVFYQRLPEADRAAVFDVYRNSADMVAVRDKIQSALKAK